MAIERLLVNKTITYLKKLEKEGKPVFWERRNAAGANYRIGLPDLYVVINGKHLEIEFKDPLMKTIEYKSEQLYWLTKFKSIGIKSIISNSWDEIKGLIDYECK